MKEKSEKLVILLTAEEKEEIQKICADHIKIKPGIWANEKETARSDAETKDKSVFMGNGMIIVCKIRILN